MIELPIKQPIISAFGHRCSIYAILSAYLETEEYLQSNYIQIYCLKTMYNNERVGTLDFYSHFYNDFHFYDHFTNPWLRANRIGRDTVKERWGDVLSFTKDRLNKHEYVYLLLDSFYYADFAKASYHPALIYGYNENNSTLFLADHDKRGKYVFQKISESDYLKASEVPIAADYFLANPDGICTYYFRKKEPYERYAFHSAKVCAKLKNYLTPFRRRNDYAYGLDCYNALTSYYKAVYDYYDSRVDLRSICSLFDHKTLMLRRLHYLERHGYVKTLISAPYKNVKDHIEIVKNTLLKFNLSKSYRFPFSQISNLLEVAADMEKTLLTRVCNEMEPIAD